MPKYILIGDVGATKTTLGLITKEKGVREYVQKKTLPSKKFDSLQSMIEVFLGSMDYKISHACFGVAGPIMDGIAVLSNLKWDINKSEIENKFNFTVRLLNDLESVALAVPHLEQKDLISLRSGIKDTDGSIAIIAPGTGLGEAYICKVDNQYFPFPSEGGNVDFAPINQTQIELLAFLQRKFGHVSYERVCSGQGIFNIYTFLKETGEFPEPNWLKQEIAAVTDPTPIISHAAEERKIEIAIKTLEIFASILGAEAGNLAVKFLSKGGIFIGGGILPKILPFFNKDIFINSFNDKGRSAELVSQIPINLIKNIDTPLIGAGICGLSDMK